LQALSGGIGVAERTPVLIDGALMHQLDARHVRDGRIAVLNKTLRGSFHRRYPAFKPRMTITLYRPRRNHSTVLHALIQTSAPHHGRHGTAVHGTRSRGRSQIVLYCRLRPHSSLDLDRRTPDEAYFDPTPFRAAA